MGKSILKIAVVSSSDPATHGFLSPLIYYYKKLGFEETGMILPFPRSHCLKEGIDCYPAYRDAKKSYSKEQPITLGAFFF